MTKLDATLDDLTAKSLYLHKTTIYVEGVEDEILLREFFLADYLDVVTIQATPADGMSEGCSGVVQRVQLDRHQNKLQVFGIVDGDYLCHHHRVDEFFTAPWDQPHILVGSLEGILALPGWELENIMLVQRNIFQAVKILRQDAHRSPWDQAGVAAFFQQQLDNFLTMAILNCTLLAHHLLPVNAQAILMNHNDATTIQTLASQDACAKNQCLTLPDRRPYQNHVNLLATPDQQLRIIDGKAFLIKIMDRYRTSKRIKFFLADLACQQSQVQALFARIVSHMQTC